MDYFAETIAYLQPSAEFVAKLSSIIPLWLIMIMVDKHFLGMPLLEGSLWYSPRIPPRLRIKAKLDRERALRTESDRYAEPLDPSSPEPSFEKITAHYAQPTQGPLLIPKAVPVGASGTTALSIHQPLEYYDPFLTSSGWHVTAYILSAVFLILLIAVMKIITNGRWNPTGQSQVAQATESRETKDVETQTLEPLTHQQLLETKIFPLSWEYVPTCPQASARQQPLTTTIFPVCWEFLPSGLESHCSGEAPKDTPNEPKTPRRSECGELMMEVPEEENTQDKKIEATKVDVTVIERRKEGRGGDGNQLASEAEERDGKKEWEEKAKVNVEEERYSESGNIITNDDLNGSPVVGEATGKKKRRHRPNAKKRAANRAAADKEVEPEAVKPGAGEALTTTNDQHEEIVAAQENMTTNSGGEYSMKEMDLHEATFVAADTAKNTQLPPRPPMPLSNEKRVPVGLPSRPLFTGLSPSRVGGSPQSSPAATGNPSPPGNLVPSLNIGATRPKGSVPPLLPHHQSFGAGNTAGPSGSSFFGAHSPDPPMFKNLPPGLFSNEAFELPSGSGILSSILPSNAGTANARPSGQTSIFQNVPTKSGPFMGFRPSSPAIANPPPTQQRLNFRNTAPLPPPLSLGINQQGGVMPLQSAVRAAENLATGKKMEEMKPNLDPRAVPFKPRPMPRGRLGLSKPERPWPSARQADGASFWRTGESDWWPHARQMKGNPAWR